MKTILLYGITTLLFFSCKPHIVPSEKSKKIVVRTFTGKGEHNEITSWFYIKNVADGGLSGYYFESTSNANDFKKAHFFYSKNRPQNFEQQYAAGEVIEFLDSKDLPDAALNDSSDLEVTYTSDKTF